ncbi:S8 family serine peptidase [Pseudoalteromonas sp. NBT06-2]|uniref:S8 family serine peptidase n=1 Tax=Pseudoalteromonas sp. NBT06-2 TaxID=2025950 RepID=UPI001482B374|nr:S8 family serine peptidase [Pseudoalteromonas sp. NBT06-2]
MKKKLIIGVLISATFGIQSQVATASTCVMTDDLPLTSISPTTTAAKTQTDGYIIGLKTPKNNLSSIQVFSGRIQVSQSILQQQTLLSNQLATKNIKVEKSFKLINALKVPQLDATQLNWLKSLDVVAYVEADSAVSLNGCAWDEGEIQPWGVGQTNSDQVWNESTGAGVKVGIIDNGVDGTHPDLADVLVEEIDLAGGSSSKFHGTHIAGTIAGAHNSIGVVGIAPDVELYSIRVFNGLSGSVSTVASGIERAVAMGLDIVNLSLGTGGSSQTLKASVEAAYEQGLIMVAATGNDSNPWLSNPGAYPETIAIGAVRKNNTRASFSNYNIAMDFVAPGTQIESTMPLGEGFCADLSSNGNPLEAFTLDRSPIGSAAGTLALVPGMGNYEDYFDANGDSLVIGKIALVNRGEIPMRDKSINAKAAGAIGMVLINSTAEDAFDYTLAFCQPDASSSDCGTGQTVPSVVIANGLGLELSQSLPEVSLNVSASDYGYMSGTSMATPHATAVAALLKAKYPDYGTEEIRQALAESAVDLRDPGKDKYTGYGLIDAAAALSVEVEPRPPVASFEYTATGLEVVFNNSSTDPDNDLESYSWSFGDGSSSSELNPIHLYAEEGTYDVALTVTDSNGNSDQTSQSITVEVSTLPPAPGGALENAVAVTDISGTKGDEVYHWWLDAAVASGEELEALQFAISGGSGDADIYVRYGAQPTTSTYDYRPYKGGNNETVDVASDKLQDGRWYVMVRAYSDYSGVDLVASYTTTVDPGNEAPQANFSSVVSDLTATFTDTSSDSDGSVVSWSWDFGDGNTSSSQNPVHTYAENGTYDVSLTVVDNEGATSDSITEAVTVVYNPPCEVDCGDTYANETDLVIPDNDWLGVKSSIAVDRTGDSGVVTVQVRINHVDADQLLVKLRAPDGTKWYVHKYEAPNVVNGIDKTLSFDASGIDSDGTWKLYLYDRTGGVVGELDSWSITYP